jgi:hypothetical protein
MVLIGLVVAATLLFSGSGMAVAQDTGGTVSPQVDPPCDGTVAPPTIGVLCSQIDLGGGSSNVVFSQNTLGDDGGYCSGVLLPPHCLDAKAADDFVVPTANSVAAWIIDTVEVSGAYYLAGQYQAASVNVEFFANSGNLPGALRYQGSYVPVGGLSTGSFVINLSAPAFLKSGQTYWVMVQANLALGGGSPGKTWSWGQRTVLRNNLSAWTNPLNGSGFECITWKPRQPAGPVGCDVGDQPDLLFRLSGRTTTTFFEVFLPLIRR